MSATQQILARLEKGGTITGVTALNMYGCYRLSDVIWKLRRRGYDIKTTMSLHDPKKSYAIYWI